jgi:hypothetical protein
MHVGPPRSPFNHAGRFTPAWTSPTRSPTLSPGTIWIPPLATASLASCHSKVNGVALPLTLAVLMSHCDDSRALLFPSGGGADGQKDYLGTCWKWAIASVANMSPFLKNIPCFFIKFINTITIKLKRLLY